MADGAIWRSRPIFITSTFRDMHAERDYLRTHVFPELEERLRERRHHLEPIDLRWGVETETVREEHAKELQVLKVCLAEVERSRPFLIGLLGDRYGWIPPEDRMAAAAQEAGFDQPVAGRSVTDLEIDFGVLSSADQKRRCFFYLRDPLPYHQMPPEVAADYAEVYNPAPGAKESTERLISLKTRIQTTLPDRCRSYSAQWDAEKKSVTGLEAWGKQVLEDLWRELEAETAEQARKEEASWQEVERWVLEQFIEERSRNFVGRETLLEALRSHAVSTAGEWGLCVTAGAGAGKSALFAELTRRLQKDNVLVLAHAAGISPQSTQADKMLRRWVAELSAALGQPDPLDEKATAEEVEQAFHQQLGQESTRRRVVILIDALNQFEPTPRARHLTWLPKLWPPNARLIVTAIQGNASESFRQRSGVKGMELPPLSHAEGEQIARAVCRRYHRSLNPPVLAALLQKRGGDGPAAGNPLWLAMAVEEINLLDADDFARADREFTGTPGARLQQLLLTVVEEMPAGVETLYGWMLERAEALFGKPWTQAFVNLIAVSRAGWRESDLRLLMPKLSGEAWEDLKFAALRRSFRTHLVQRGAQAQRDFSHAQMRQAVLRRNLANAESVLAHHGALAAYLIDLPPEDPLHQTETMVHLIGAEDCLRAARYYGSEMTAGEAAGATRALADVIVSGRNRDPNPGLAWALSLLDLPALGNEERGWLCNRFNFDLNDALENDVTLGARVILLHSARQTLERLSGIDPGNAAWQRDLVVSYYNIASLNGRMGENEEAAVFWQRCRDTLRSMKQRGMHLDAPLVQLLEQLERAE